MSGFAESVSYGPTFTITDEEKIAIDFEHIFRIKYERTKGMLSQEQKRRSKKAFVVYDLAAAQSVVFIAPRQRMPMDGMLVRGTYNDIRRAVLQA